MNPTVADQIEILRRICEKAREKTIEGKLPHNQQIDTWTHLLDEVLRLRVYINGGIEL